MPILTPELIFEMMQMAVDIVHTSPHPTNKIAVSIYGRGMDGKPYKIASTNEQPAALMNILKDGEKIGNASPSIHGEMAATIDAPYTNSAKIFITDPPCPNCAKYIAEAGYTDVYIDHKGFEKDFYERRKDTVTLSFDILEDAGISVHKVFRKDGRIETLVQADPLDKIDYDGYHITAPSDAPIETSALLETAQTHAAQSKKTFALLAATDAEGRHVTLYSESARHGTKHDTPCGKYSLTMRPLNRAFMLAARHGLTIDRTKVITSHVPTSREFVNAVGAGVRIIHILDKNNARDEQSMRALNQIMKADILDIQ